MSSIEFDMWSFDVSVGVALDPFIDRWAVGSINDNERFRSILWLLSFWSSRNVSVISCAWNNLRGEVEEESQTKLKVGEG